MEKKFDIEISLASTSDGDVYRVNLFGSTRYAECASPDELDAKLRRFVSSYESRGLADMLETLKFKQGKQVSTSIICNGTLSDEGSRYFGA